MILNFQAFGVETRAGGILYCSYRAGWAAADRTQSRFEASSSIWQIPASYMFLDNPRHWESA